MKKVFSKNSNNQQGALLVMVIIIMGILILTVLVVSFLVTREVRLSSKIEDSMLALYASESGLEYGLYEVYVNDLPTVAIDGSAGTLSNDATWTILAEDKTDVFFKDTLLRDAQLVLKLYDYTNQASASGIEQLYINWTVGKRLHILSQQWNGQEFESPATERDYYCSTVPCNPITFNTNSAVPVLVVLTAIDDDIQELQIEAEPVGKEIPLPITLKSTGYYGSSGQAMESRIPQFAPWE